MTPAEATMHRATATGATRQPIGRPCSRDAATPVILRVRGVAEKPQAHLHKPPIGVGGLALRSGRLSQ